MLEKEGRRIKYLYVSCLLREIGRGLVYIFLEIDVELLFIIRRECLFFICLGWKSFFYNIES